MYVNPQPASPRHFGNLSNLSHSTKSYVEKERLPKNLQQKNWRVFRPPRIGLAPKKHTPTNKHLNQHLNVWLRFTLTLVFWVQFFASLRSGRLVSHFCCGEIFVARSTPLITMRVSQQRWQRCPVRRWKGVATCVGVVGWTFFLVEAIWVALQKY